MQLGRMCGGVGLPITTASTLRRTASAAKIVSSLILSVPTISVIRLLQVTAGGQ